ncbi:MAG: tRNA (adenosine(37)-N6)-threonylcarbamoyltransferase complex transferase subunit TsaD [Prevotellaceae bacterium]|jgi:N6-L-threonylcarbamoyladenine synthase|nr:tRNA (adenosine(37)-N6)-threonylcarbamoyltransferase complex transferase subunit TsaD [Prevotellaceae bacterium]
MTNPVIILGIESSCDDTSAAVLADGILLSNVTASQSVHQKYGGVVPELASRAHQQNIIPVVDAAIQQAGISKTDISATAFTLGPGLLGSLLVGTSFAKSFATALNIPIIEVNHLQAHVLAHFIAEKDSDFNPPKFPFLCLLVSGGNSQIILAKNYNDFEVAGQTIDDAAGEAFDKCAKIMNLPYPGGPLVDKLAKEGNAEAFKFAKPNIAGYDYSFSGLKTSFLYFLRGKTAENPDFIEQNKADLCASLQKTIIDILMNKLILAAKNLNINQIAVAGGVSANSGLRNVFVECGAKFGWQTFIPKFSFTTDNAAMVAISGHFKYINGDFGDISKPPFARTMI